MRLLIKLLWWYFFFIKLLLKLIESFFELLLFNWQWNLLVFVVRKINYILLNLRPWFLNFFLILLKDPLFRQIFCLTFLHFLNHLYDPRLIHNRRFLWWFLFQFVNLRLISINQAFIVRIRSIILRSIFDNFGSNSIEWVLIIRVNCIFNHSN